MSASLTEWLVTRLATRSSGRSEAADRPSRRGFLASATLGGAALALQPWSYLTRPADAYSSLCGTDASCSSGYSAFCCTINGGRNTCPPHTYPGGWWKADRSSYCGGGARYYIDCNARPGATFHCHCADNGSCDHRLVACNVFRYGQCNTQIPGVTAVVCRQISCRPPWQVYPEHCGRSSATDNNTARHTAPCLNHDNTFPPLRHFPDAPHLLHGGHELRPGQRLTSLNRHTTAVFLEDGNFEVRNQHGAVWRSSTLHKAQGGRVHLFHHGNLVIYDRHDREVWQTDTGGPGKHWRLNMRNDGNLVIENSQHPDRIRWATHTHTR